MPADVVQLAAYRARAKTSAPRSVAPAYLGAEAGKVILEFTNREQVVLSPAHARVWAERLAAMADTAEALAGAGVPRG